MSGNENITSIKGHNFVTNLRKITSNNPKLDLVNINAHIKFHQVLSISSENIEQKLNFDKPMTKFCYKFAKYDR